MKKERRFLQIRDFNDISPFLVLVAVAVFFAIATGGKIFIPSSLSIIVDQSITTMVGGLGMIFVIALGGTDITAGGVVACAGLASYLLGCRYGSFVAFLVAIAIGAASGTLLGVVNAKFKVPSFMASLALGIIALRGIANVIINNMKTEVIITPQILAINDMSNKLPIAIVLIIIVIFVYHFTPFGYYIRAIGENEVAVKYVGINIVRTKIVAFIISGIMAGFAAVFTISRAAGVQNSLGTGFEMNIMMALFVAGIPVTGGMGAKLFKLFIGVFSMVILRTGMVLCGLSGGFIQGVIGIILLGIVYLTANLNAKGSTGIRIKLHDTETDTKETVK